MPVQIGTESVEVIDAHIHTFPDAIAPGAVGRLQKISGLIPQTNGTVSDTLRLMEEQQMDRALLLNIATAPKQQQTINNCAKELADKIKDRFIPFGSVHFEAPDALTELERIKAMGLKGIKLHPDYQGFLINDEKLFPIYEKCADLGLPIIFHSGFDCYSPELIHAPPKASREVVRRFPKLKIILAHFGGFQQWDDVEKYLIGEDVYFDTAMCASNASKEQIERMIRSHDPDKILLGSDCPWENPAVSLKFILSMDLSDGQKAKIVSGNVKQLLHI